MTPQERELVTELFDRLATLENTPRDPEAERGIMDGSSGRQMRPMRWSRPRWCRTKMPASAISKGSSG
jgi:hypothetical protein